MLPLLLQKALHELRWIFNTPITVLILLKYACPLSSTGCFVLFFYKKEF